MVHKFFKRWGRDKSGTTAIEFSLLAVPFLLLTLGIIEISLMYASASLLEGATNSAARTIRTGQIQQSTGDPETMFRQEICNYATVLIRCDDVIIEAQTMAGFSDYSTMSVQLDVDGNMVSQGFDVGGSNERVLVRVAYRYSMMTPLVGPLLYGVANGRLFISTIVLQTEPYEFNAGA